MVKKEIVKKEVIKRKKKNWHAILAPKIFKNVELGETLGTTSEDLLGKKLVLSLGIITKQPKKGNILLKFIIDKVQEGKGHTSILGYEISPAQVKRVIRKGKTKIEDSIVFITKDNIKVRVKPLIITANKVTSSKEKEVRRQLKTFLKDQISNLSYEGLVESLINSELQINFKKSINKVYQTSFCDIRVMNKIESKQEE